LYTAKQVWIEFSIVLLQFDLSQMLLSQVNQKVQQRTTLAKGYG
jgi:hypothetical protein